MQPKARIAIIVPFDTGVVVGDEGEVNDRYIKTV
jgi:hypothetical protein